MLRERRILIFTGGHLGLWALAEVQPGDFLVGVDRGTLFLLENHQRPDFALGDFDSVSTMELDSIKQYCQQVSCYDPIAKDHSDTELAFRWALEQKPQEILLLGALGTRFDHALANIHLLRLGLQAQIKSRIVGEANEILLTDSTVTVTGGRYQFISLLPLTPEVNGITLSGFQYPLQQATLQMGSSLGISNLLTAETGTIEVSSGELLIIKSRD